MISIKNNSLYLHFKIYYNNNNMKKIYSLLFLLTAFVTFAQNTAPAADNQTVTTDNYTDINITLTGSDADLSTLLTVHTIKGSKLENSAGSGFGEYIELSSDGKRIVVGGWIQNNVRSFEWDGAEWGQFGQTIDGTSGGKFGEFVSMSDDGNRIAGYDENNKKVYAYSLDGTTWGQNLPVMTLTAARGLNLSGDGNTLAAVDFALGKVYLRKWNGTKWMTPRGPVTIQSGFSVAPGMISLSQDGKRFAIGTKVNNEVAIYDLSGGKWNKTITITGSNNFGETLRLSSDGNKLVVGINGAGSARVYDLSGSTAVQTGSDIVYGSGAAWRSLSMSDDGKRVAIPIYGQKTGIFDWDGTSWNKLGADITGGGSLFGESLDISEDGKIVAIGGHDGHVEILDVLNFKYIITSLPTGGKLKQGTNELTSSDLPFTFISKDPVINYVPNSSFTGADSFKFKTNDTMADSNEATVTINVSGSSFSLQDDNNKIVVGTCTCNGKKDGSLALSIEDVRYDYTITVSGVADPITIKGTNKTANVTGLGAGKYTVCFKVDSNPSYEQCFEATITEPNSL